MIAQHNFNVRVRGISHMVTIILVAIIFFLASTAFIHLIVGTSGPESIFRNNTTISYLVSLFNLSGENTLATWFSSMMLLLAGLLAMLCYWLDRSFADQSIFRYGWIFMSLFFFLLSLDEIGSLHENAGAIASLDVAGNGGWESVVFVPLGIVIVYMGVFAFRHLKNHRSSFFLMLIGMLLIMSIPLHEYFEMKSWSESSYSPEWRRPVGLVLFEEGSELFAFFSFLLAMKLFVAQRSGEEGVVVIPKSRVFRIFRLSSFCMFLTALLLYFSIDVLSADEGIALNWFPSAMAFICSMTVLAGAGTLWTALMFIILSIFFGINFYALMQWNEISLLRYTVGTVIVAMIACWTVRELMPEQRFLRRSLIILASLCVLSSLFVSEVEITFIGLIGFSFLAGYLATAPENSEIIA